MFGEFVLRQSLDGGRSWGAAAERWAVPVRRTRIDAQNAFARSGRAVWDGRGR
mgnify:FL=1|jgi:hypothetical protein